MSDCSWCPLCNSAMPHGGLGHSCEKIDPEKQIAFEKKCDELSRKVDAYKLPTVFYEKYIDAKPERQAPIQRIADTLTADDFKDENVMIDLASHKKVEKDLAIVRSTLEGQRGLNRQAWEREKIDRNLLHESLFELKALCNCSCGDTDTDKLIDKLESHLKK